MHVRLMKRHCGGLWRSLSRVAVAALAIEVLLLLGAGCVRAAEVAVDGALPVATMALQRQPHYRVSRVYAGRTAPARAAELGFKQGGEIDALQVDLGDSVTAGSLLGELDLASLDAALARAEADVRLAEASVAARRADVELAAQTEARFRELQTSGHASAQVYDERRLALAASRAQLDVARAALAQAEAGRRAAQVARREAQLYAPFNAVVQARYVDEGSQVAAGQPVLRLVEAARTEAHVGVPEGLAGSLERDGDYRLRWRGQALSGRLRTVLPEVDGATRTLTAVFDLEAPGERPAPPLGSVVELELEQAVAGDGFWLPMTALAEADRGLWGVFVVNDDSLVERRLVEIVHIEADRAFVRGTLASGDEIVRSGVQRIVPGQAVRRLSQG